MGTVCTSQKIQQQQQVHRTLATENQLTEHNHNYQMNPLNEIEPMEDLKQSKIDGAQNSIDLLKKRQPSRDMSQMSRALDEQRSSQNRVERFTLDIRDHQASQSKEKRQSIMKDRSSKSLHEDNYDENTYVNTIHKNKCKAKLQMNANSIILLSLNRKTDFLRTYKKMLYKIVNDQCHIHENKQLINSSILASSEAFLKNIQITDKHINFYGVFHILSQSLKQLGLQILLQNENQQLSNITLSNRLQLQLKDLPQVLAINQQKIYSIHINKSYDDLYQNYQQLSEFIRYLTLKIYDILNLNGIKNQDILVLSIFRQEKGISVQLLLPNLTTILCGFVYDIIDKNLKNKQMIQAEPLIKYVSVQQSDFNVWKSREIRLESSFDTVVQQQGWKLFALNSQLQDYYSYGYINMSKHIDYSNLINVFELNDVPKYNGDNDLIELKIFGEKKSFKMIFQIDYDPENVIVKQDSIQVNIGQSNLLGILIYDLDKRFLRQSMSVQQLLMDLHF